MIDAYEIGVQLALQDGVSAGLDVINRELAEVDRAIVATSAGLNQLAHVADLAGKAVAAVSGVKAPSVNQGEVSESTNLDEPSGAAAVVETGPSTAIFGEVYARPASAPIAQDPAAPASPPEIRRDEVKTSPPLIVPVSATPTAPETRSLPLSIHPVVATSVSPSVASPGSSSVEAGVPSAPARQSREVRTEAFQVAPAVAQPPPAAPEKQQPTFSGPITSSIARAVAPTRLSERRSAHTAKFSRDPVPTDRESSRAAVAPWSPADTQAASPQQVWATERAVAPQSKPREGGEGGSGMVMLDGRLVGYWLSEQMAREASRPPSSTSFFDPRQAPAWTAAGAL